MRVLWVEANVYLMPPMPHLLGTLDDLREVEEDAVQPRVRRHDRGQDGAVGAGDVNDPIVQLPPEVCDDRRRACVHRPRSNAPTHLICTHPSIPSRPCTEGAKLQGGISQRKRDVAAALRSSTMMLMSFPAVLRFVCFGK